MSISENSPVIGGVKKSVSEKSDKETKHIEAQIEAEREIRLKELDNQKNKDDMGKVGWWLGNKDHQVVFITSFIIIAFLLMVGYGYVYSPDNPNIKDYIEKFIAVITLCLGYLFGKAAR